MDIETACIHELGSAVRVALRNADSYRAWLGQVRAVRWSLGSQDFGRLGLEPLLDGATDFDVETDPAHFALRLTRLMHQLDSPEGVVAARALTDAAAYQSTRLGVEAVREGVQVVFDAARPIVQHASISDLVALVKTVPGSVLVPTVDDDLNRRGAMLVRGLTAKVPAVTADRLTAAYLGDRQAGSVLSGPYDIGIGNMFGGEWQGPVSLWDETPGQEEQAATGEGTYVNVGLAPVDDPGRSWLDEVLTAGATCLVWVQLGLRQPDALPGDTSPVPSKLLSEGEELEIVIFPDAAVQLTGAGSGRVRMENLTSFPVVRPADLPVGGATDRLYMGLRLPDRAGLHRVRCVLISRGLIIQVEQITLPVGLSDQHPSIRTTYQLLDDLSRNATLAELTPPAVAIYTNPGEGTHDFSFYTPEGADQPGLAEQVHLESGALTSSLITIRQALSKIAWGSSDDYRDELTATHSWQDGHFVSRRTSIDDQLVELAYVGSHVWAGFKQNFSPSLSTGLARQLRTGGAVQLAPRRGLPTQAVPLQMIYDFPLNTAHRRALHLCTGSKAFVDGHVTEVACLQTSSCVDRDKDAVCIAGFWGYRLAVTTCLDVPCRCGQRLDPKIPSRPRPSVVAGRSTDPAVAPYWTQHHRGIFDPALVDLVDPVATTAETMLADLSTKEPSIIYFLTHVVKDDYGFFKIAFDNGGGQGIDVNTLEDVRLCRTRPVVVINGCASAALLPERVVSLVGDFHRSGASGAVGTEITIFASLATEFARALFSAFAGPGHITLPDAVRRARLSMLQLGNPLGLAYANYGLHDLHLQPPDLGSA